VAVSKLIETERLQGAIDRLQAVHRTALQAGKKSRQVLYMESLKEPLTSSRVDRSRLSQKFRQAISWHSAQEVNREMSLLLGSDDTHRPHERGEQGEQAGKAGGGTSEMVGGRGWSSLGRR
jgi:hypothetical protein